MHKLYFCWRTKFNCLYNTAPSQETTKTLSCSVLFFALLKEPLKAANHFKQRIPTGVPLIHSHTIGQNVIYKLQSVELYIQT